MNNAKDNADNAKANDNANDNHFVIVSKRA